MLTVKPVTSSFASDPWLIRKEPRKGKEKKKKKKRKKSIDPDSIQSALLASGLGSTRPAFTASVNTPSTPATGKQVTTRQSMKPHHSDFRGLLNFVFLLVDEVKAESQDSCITSQDAVEHAQKMKRDLLEKLEELAEDLPPNTLDELIDELGGPDNVAEVSKHMSFLKICCSLWLNICILTHSAVLQMTGRKGRVVSNDDGSITYESRSELDVPVEILNLTEKQRFMDGEKVNAALPWKRGRM